MKLEEMRKITNAATRGPWVFEPDSVYIDIDPTAEDGEFILMARNKMDKLIAVAEAAKRRPKHDKDSFTELDLALEELEK